MAEKSDQNTEYTKGFGSVILITALLTVPILVVNLLPFIAIWGYQAFELGKNIIKDNFLIIVIFGVVMHELFHGLSWGYYASKGMKSIKFGFQWKTLTPYCHCSEPLKVWQYKIGAAMPLIVLGIMPSIIALVIGNGAFLTFGIFFTWGACGDIISLFMLRKLNNQEYVSDHPDKMGFIRMAERSEQPGA